MKRTQIYLTERQIEILNKESDNKGLSLSELIRRIIDGYLELKLENKQWQNQKDIGETGIM